MISRWGRLAAAAAACFLAQQGLAAKAVEDAQALMAQGQYAQALQLLEGHLRQSPQDAEARFARGLALVRLNRSEEALKVFADLTRDYPQLPEPYNNLAVLYAQRGDYEKARDALEAALATHPSYATAHENLGDIYAALASAAYNRALQLDQGNAAVRNKLRMMDGMNTTAVAAADAPAPLPAMPAAPVAPATPPVTPPPATPAAPPVTPAAPPVAPATPAAPAGDMATSAAIQRAVNDWAGAWSARDASRYIAAYDASFLPEGGLDRATWESQRRARLQSASSISVRVASPQIDMVSADQARVTFQQQYQSDNYSDEVTKVLELRRGADGWRITREYTR